VNGSEVTVRMLFADHGGYRHEDVAVPAGAVDRYDRLIDCLREDPEVLKRIYVDVGRLCAAYLIREEASSHAGQDGSFG
jgi:hypothetical protein